ncbi:ribose 5-phosphate isomerase B [Paenibacillus pasadenensis]|uniref:ribose 5-phosphate isomerase B n=1 Tax=Paenibacillus pasadenensis TaxID=217090 RepID=UPI00203D1F52|nr:ribose 5-phosphate isomerase B [Paenibacillus pasadenensis]MCM3747042.1 ribose 5-phosphate isomerase B [Paenibacillus pasadenensis]
MKIGIGADQNGFEMKEQLKHFLLELGHEVDDYGCDACQSVDYPDIAFQVAQHISEGRLERGLLICGTGIGVAIAAGKYPGIRAALCHDPYSAERSQKSNNAQIITMGAQIIGVEAAKKVVEAWASSFFEDGRSTAKIQKIIDKEREILKNGFPETKADSE